jgi:peroxiredoxin
MSGPGRNLGACKPRASTCRGLAGMYGRKYFGNERTSFVIDSEGVVAEVLRKVKPAEHLERVLAALAHTV